MDQLTAAFDNLADKLNGWLNALITAIPNLALALLVMVAGYFLSRFLKRYVEKGVRRMSSNPTVTNLLTNLATFAFFLLTLFLVLGILNLEKPLNSLLAGAGVVGLAVGLALQEPLTNIFSGILLSVRDMYNVGDLITTNDYFGTIKEITLRTTILKQPTGEEVTIPNKLVLQNPLVNYTATPERQVVLECGVSYGDDLEKVREVALEAIKGNLDFNQERGVELFFTEFGSSSINFILRFWLSQSSQGIFLNARSEAVIALKKAFDASDITIPFPIRTLDFGIKGGEKLAEQRLSVLPYNNREGDGDAD